MEGLIQFVLPLALFIGLMYFMIIRPQKKQMEENQNMLDSLVPGDEAVTIGGLHGIIDEIDKEAGKVVLDCEGVYLTFDLRAIGRKEAGTAQTQAPEQLEETEVQDEDNIEEE